MKILKFGVVLLALLLAAMAMVPIVSADTYNKNAVVADPLSSAVINPPVSKESISANYISVETATNFATESLAETITLKTMGDSINWDGANLNPEPLTIYDLNGERIFYQFWIEKNGEKIGKIRVAASKVLGSPIKYVGTSSPQEIDVPGLVMKANEIVKTNFTGYTIQSTKLICYDSPYLALLAELTNPQTKENKKIVIDAIFKDYQEIPQGKEREFSYYDTIPQANTQSGIGLWNKENDRINKVTDKITALKIAEKMNAQKISINLGTSNENSESLKTTILSGFAASSNYGVLSPQLVQYQGARDWCMIFAAWSMTEYYRIKGIISQGKTPNQIATKMGVVNLSGYAGAPSADAEFQYYSDYLNGGIGVGPWGRQSRNPYYYEISNSIGFGYPLKTVTLPGHINPTKPSGHARACYGFDSRNGVQKVYYSDSASNNVYWEDFQPSASFIYRL